VHTNLYWIHADHHTDMSSEGYIGVTQYFNDRLCQHKSRRENRHLSYAIDKYGWDNLKKEIILIADEDYCYEIEKKLRPNKNIGWNLCEGGGKPPLMKGPRPHLKGRVAHNKGKTLSEESKKKISDSVKEQMLDSKRREISRQTALGNTYRRGKKHKPESIEKMVKSRTGIPSPFKGVPATPSFYEKIWRNSQIEWECPHCGKIGKSKGAANRWHFDNCREKI